MEIRDRIKEFKRVPAKDLLDNPLNWRKHPRDQQIYLQGILEEIGYAGALLVREENGKLVLIDGHLRKDLTPDQEVPVLILDVNKEEADKLLIAFDPIAGMAKTEKSRLESLLRSVNSGDPRIQELMEKIARDNKIILSSMNEGETKPDELPENVEAITKLGDLWTLGNHKLLCGDSTKNEDVLRVMGDEKAALVATDPPYLVDYTGERPNDSGKDWTSTYREIDIKDAEAFFRNVFQNILQVVAAKSAIYCWHAHKRTGVIQRIWEELGIIDHQQIVWVKPTSVFGRVYWHFRHEPCIMGWVKGHKPEHDGNHEFNSVWEVDWDGKARIVGNEHPTEKPVELFARPIRKHTKPGELCFEPFSGSGSQIIACERTGRACRAIELTPIYVDVAVKRWENFTGKTAQKE